MERKMEFTEIDDDNSVFPGEDYIRVLKQGKYLEDKIGNFKKIKLSEKEKKDKHVRKCSGCKGI